MSGHSGGFQRVDRMTAAHSLEVEMPFMDEEVVRFAFSIPGSWKIHGQDKAEKWILRRTFEKDLPASITWRKKQKFYQGSDTGTVMKAFAEKCVSDRELTREQRRYNRQFASKEELLYYRIFAEYFPHASCEDTVGHTRTIMA
ncbi:MAG: asparagine synthase-related protein [Bacillota bacterium]